jgi:hypothetical protein
VASSRKRTGSGCSRCCHRRCRRSQPGGAEWPAITEACRVKAARSDVAEVPPAELVWWVAELWPWAGEPLLLFEDDPAKREAARQAAARHVLQPRSDDYGQEVRRMMREGCGRSSSFTVAGELNSNLGAPHRQSTS